MDFISEFGFDVKQGKSHEFQEWLGKNESTLASEAPPGWQYIGTYAVVMSSEKDAGAYRQLWRHDSYGAMDTFAAAMKDGGKFAAALDEVSREFMDQEKDARWSSSVYKAVTDTSIWGEA